MSRKERKTPSTAALAETGHSYVEVKKGYYNVKPKNPMGIWTPAEIQQLFHYWIDGKSLSDMMDIFGRTRSAIYARMWLIQLTLIIHYGTNWANKMTSNKLHICWELFVEQIKKIVMIRNIFQNVDTAYKKGLITGYTLTPKGKILYDNLMTFKSDSERPTKKEKKEKLKNVLIILLKEGLTVNEIAKRMKVHPITVSRWLMDCGLANSPRIFGTSIRRLIENRLRDIMKIHPIVDTYYYQKLLGQFSSRNGKLVFVPITMIHNIIAKIRREDGKKSS